MKKKKKGKEKTKPKKETGLFLEEKPPNGLKQRVNLSSATSEEEFAIEEFFVHIMLSNLSTSDRSVSILYASHHDIFYCCGFSMKIR